MYLLASLLFGLPADGPAPVAAAIPRSVGPCTAGWQELPLPDAAFRGLPWKVVTREGRPAWLVGGSNEGLLALRWRRGAWRMVETDTSGRRGLADAVVYGRSGVLGVGHARPYSGTLRPISGRLRPSGWLGRGAPHAGRSHAALTGVVRAASGGAWAVGTRLAGGRAWPLALRWDGRGWRAASPRRAGRDTGLLAIGRARSGPLWAVGWRATASGQPRPLILRRAAPGWRRVRPASLVAGSAALTDIAFRSAREGWAVGYLQPSGTALHRPILQRWDGRAWRKVPLPWAADMSAVPRSIDVGPDGRVWLAGTQLPNASRLARGFVASRAPDGSWALSVLGVPPDVHSEILSVAATDEGAMAAGRVGGSAIALRTCEAAEPAAARRRRIALSEVRRRRRATSAHPRDDPGRLVAPATTGPAVYLGRPVEPTGFRLRDVTARVGLAETTETYSGLVADLDRDGWTDVLYSRHSAGSARLALGGPNGFNDAPAGVFGRRDRHGCAVADVDGDDAPDVLCAIGRGRGTTIDRHELSLRPAYPDGRVEPEGLGIVDPFGRGRRVAFLRLDDDPWPEAFIVGAADREDLLPAPNRFFRNRGGRFTAAPGVGLDRPVGGACLRTVDLEGDGDDDLLHCQTHPRDGRPPGLRIHRNEGGRLRERSAALGVEPMGDLDALIVDLTGDGRGDLVQLSADRLRVSRRTRTGFRRIFQARVSHAEAVAAGDASGDGAPDLYILRGGRRRNRPDLLLVNERRGRSFTSVRIPQTTEGRADDVMALDHDRNGLMDFLVLDGRGRPGPVRLLASYPED